MKKAITLLLTLTMTMSLVACGNKAENDGASASGTSSQVHSSETDKNDIEPVSLGDFSVKDFDGNTVTKDIFSEYDLTMVNVWSTTCGYCIEEMPALNELRNEFQDEGVSFNIISFCMDIGNTDNIDEANLEKAKEIVQKTGVQYPNLIPDSVLLDGRLKGIQAFPESFFVDRAGNVVSEPYAGAMPKNHWKVTIQDELEKIEQNSDKE